MEITVRSGSDPVKDERRPQFAAAATFLQPGPLALVRIPLAARADTHAGVMRTLVEGFKVNPGSLREDSVEFRALTALTTAVGVMEINTP